VVGFAFELSYSLLFQLSGIEHVSSTLDIDENIAVATFGQTTGVALHLTNDYSRVKQAISTNIFEKMKDYSYINK